MAYARTSERIAELLGAVRAGDIDWARAAVMQYLSAAELDGLIRAFRLDELETALSFHEKPA